MEPGAEFKGTGAPEQIVSGFNTVSEAQGSAKPMSWYSKMHMGSRLGTHPPV